jgi:hypothetical protein
MKAVQPKTAEPGSGATSSFFKKGGDASLSNETPFFSKGNPVQTKLTMGQPNDQFEQEADSMANKVVQRLAEPDSIQTKPIQDANNITPFVQTKCEACTQEEKLQKKEEEKEQTITPDLMTKSAMGETPPLPPPADDDEKGTSKRVQRKCADCEKEEKLQKKGDASSVSPALEQNITTSKGGGSPLPNGIRTNMESSMGADFSNVRVHTNSNAAGMSSQLGAQAFTHGNDIFFNSGKYNPDNKSGQHLLAHELTHTVQQGNSKTTGIHARLLQMKQDTLQLQANLAAHAEMVMSKQDTPNVQAGLWDTLTDYAASAFGSLEEMLDIELPSSPLEAIRMIVEAADRHPTIVNTVPGLSSIVMMLRSVVMIADLIQYVIDHKEEIIQTVKTWINQQIAKSPEYIMASLANVPGMNPNHAYILWTYYISPAIDKLLTTDWWEVVKDLLWQQIWPFEGITTLTEPNVEDRKGFGADLHDLWTHVSNLVSALSGLHISQAIDEGLFVQRSINAIAGRFYGWVALILMLVEAIPAGIAAAPGGPAAIAAAAAAGAGAGLATADVFGMGLLAISAGTEIAIALKSVLSLNPVHESITDEDKAHQNHDYYTQITQSMLSLGIMGVMAAFAWLGGKLAGAIVSKLSQYLPRSIQNVIQAFITGYRARQAALLGRTAPPEPNTGGNNGGGGSGGTGGNGSTGERPNLTGINGEGQGGARPGTVNRGGGGRGGGGGDAYDGNAARQIDISPDPNIDRAVDPNVVPNPNPKYPPWLQPVPDPVPTPVPEPVPAVTPDPVAPPVAGTTPQGSTIPGTGLGGALGVDLGHKKNRKDKNDKKDKKVYQWAQNSNLGNYYLTYATGTKGNIRWVQHDHHVWPKVLGGPEQQTFLTVIDSIHTSEMHYGWSPANSPVPAKLGSIYEFLTNVINSHPEFGPDDKDILQGEPLQHPGGPGNDFLVDRMKVGDRLSRRLKNFVRDAMTAFYGVYSFYSSPVMPYSAYRKGLDESYNAI